MVFCTLRLLCTLRQGGHHARRPCASLSLSTIASRLGQVCSQMRHSVQAGNRKLADLYLHELEEVAEETAEDVETYEGAPVGQLVNTLLLPAIEAAEARLEDNPADRGAVAGLIDTCNQCHQSTGHAEIRIVPATVNPFNQDFAPR